MQYFNRSFALLVVTVLMMGVSQQAESAFVLPKQIKLADMGGSQSSVDKDRIRIKGSATKGPIAGASVAVYEIDDQGFPVGSAIATTTTDATGDFTLSLPAFDEILLVQTRGGSFIDESDTRPLEQRRRISLASDEGFMSIIEPGQGALAITPFTDGLVERARIGGRLGGFDDVMKRIIESSTAGFGFNLFSTEPPDPANPGSATEAERQYAMAIGATANLANVAAIIMRMPAPTYDVIKAVIYDLSDGDTDGLMDGQPIMVGNRTLPALNFDHQLIRFRNNNYASYGTTPLPEWDDADSALGLGIPTFLYGVYENENIPVQFGIATYHWGKLILNPDGTGTLTNRDGEGQFNWAGAAGNLVLDFAAFGGFKSIEFTDFSFDSTTGQQVEFISYQSIERMDAYVGTTGTGKPALFIEVEGKSVRTKATTGEVTETPYDYVDETVTIYDAADIEPVPDPATFDFDPALLAFNDKAVLSDGSYYGTFVDDVDVMTFNANGTGSSKYDNDLFTWELRGDGRLQIDFNNNETAIYTLLYEDDPDLDTYVAVDYEKNGERFHNGVRVLSENPAATWNNANVVGIIEQPGSVVLSSGEVVADPAIAYLRPDGTGVIEFRYYDYTTNDSSKYLVLASSRSICWEIDAQGYLNRKRALFVEFSETSGSVKMPTPQDCAALPDDSIEWIRSFDIMEQDGEKIEAVVRFFDNEDCLFVGEPTCLPNQLLSTFPSVQQRIETFTANPPYANRDLVSATRSQSTLTINVLSNDRPGDLAIDRSSLELGNGIFNEIFRGESTATASVNAAGEVEIQLNGTTANSLLLNYTVRDTDGNPSNTGIISVSINP